MIIHSEPRWEVRVNNLGELVIEHCPLSGGRHGLTLNAKLMKTIASYIAQQDKGRADKTTRPDKKYNWV